MQTYDVDQEAVGFVNEMFYRINHIPRSIPRDYAEEMRSRVLELLKEAYDAGARDARQSLTRDDIEAPHPDGR